MTAVPVILPQIEAVLEGTAITCTVRESGRAKHLGLWIAPETGLVMTAPEGMSKARLQAYLRQHRRWILRQVLRMERYAEIPRRWPYGPAVLYHGDPHAVLARKSATGRVERDGRQLLVSTRTPNVEGVRRILQRWMQAEAVRAIGGRVQALGQRMGLAPKRIYVRALKRRWGSCWPGGSLSFNYGLVMAPPSLLDYVVVHELAHLREPNHSSRFWSLVATEYPDHLAARRQLRMLGPCLSV